VMPLDASTGAPVPLIVADDEHVEAIRKLEIGQECAVERFKPGADGKPYLVWSDGTLFDPAADPDRCTRRFRAGALAYDAAGPRRESIEEKREPDPEAAVETIRLRRVA